MNLVLDCLVVKHEQGGLSAYAHALAAALSQVPGVDLLVLCDASTASDWGALRTMTARLGKNGPVVRGLWRKSHLRELARRYAATAIVTVSPEWTSAGSVPTVVVVHDLGPVLAPGLYGLKRYLRYAVTLRPTITRASAIIAVSATTKTDLVRWLGTAWADKIRVIHNAAQPFTNVADTAGGQTSDYALYVGSYLPHKNASTVLRAFELGGAGLPKSLICVGPDYNGERRSTFAPFRGASWLRVAGFVSSEELAALYSKAAIVLVPSLFEGYGMPVIEALAFGRPVLASPLPVFRELVGDAIHYVSDPLSPDAWIKAMSACLTSKPDAGSPAVPDGRLLSWARVASEVVELVESLSPTVHVGKLR